MRSARSFTYRPIFRSHCTTMAVMIPTSTTPASTTLELQLDISLNPERRTSECVSESPARRWRGALEKIEIAPAIGLGHVLCVQAAEPPGILRLRAASRRRAGATAPRR